jgi:hypothetical protein
MLRPLALIARTDPFDDTRLNTQGLFGQAKRSDLLEQPIKEMSPTRLRYYP